MKSFKFLLAVSLVLVLFSCNKEEDTEVIIDYVGSADYQVKNNLDTAVVISFTTSAQLGNEEVDSISLDANTTVSIFYDAVIGRAPNPTDSFSEIRIFLATDLENPLLVLSPVENEDWILIDELFNTEGPSLPHRVYEFVLND